MSQIPGTRSSADNVYYLPSSYDPLPRPERLRRQAGVLKLSNKDARLRLGWFIWHEEQSGQDVALIRRHFGIARKTFYKWKKPFDAGRLEGLEEKSRRPQRLRRKQFIQEQYLRFLPLRKKYLRYSKEKLLRIYQGEHPEDACISAWKIQKMIEKSGLYYHASGMPISNGRKGKHEQNQDPRSKPSLRKLERDSSSASTRSNGLRTDKRDLSTPQSTTTPNLPLPMPTRSTPPKQRRISSCVCTVFLREELLISKPTMVVSFSNISTTV